MPRHLSTTPPSLRDIGENGLLRHIAEWTAFAGRLPDKSGSPAASLLPSWAKAEVLVSIGDDAAVIRAPDSGALLAVTTDMLVEGTHFLPDQPPESLGAKSANANLSDLAAVGAAPSWLLVSVGAPGSLPVSWLEKFYAGLRSVLDLHGCFCVGGDTVRSPRLTINIVAGGFCDPGASLPLRDRARPGQSLFVTGTLGDSGAGLFLLRNPGAAKKAVLRPQDSVALVERHRQGAARIAAGMAIARHCPDAAMMDLSDGLAADLPRLAEASGCGFEIRLGALPLSTRLRRTATALDLEAWHFALFGGEDYELLFTTSLKPAQCQHAVTAAPQGRPLRITRIGRAVEKPGVFFHDARGRPLDLRNQSFHHF